MESKARRWHQRCDTVGATNARGPTTTKSLPQLIVKTSGPTTSPTKKLAPISTGTVGLREFGSAHPMAHLAWFGHWECDLIQFRKKYGKANVTSLV